MSLTSMSLVDFEQGNSSPLIKSQLFSNTLTSFVQVRSSRTFTMKFQKKIATMKDGGVLKNHSTRSNGSTRRRGLTVMNTDPADVVKRSAK